MSVESGSPTQQAAASAVDAQVMIMRFGCIVVPLVTESQDGEIAINPKDSWDRLRTALEDDARVASVSVVESKLSRFSSGQFIGRVPLNPSEESLLERATPYDIELQCSDSLQLKVSIPAKNQPTLFAKEPSPESYVGLSDGLILGVGWLQSPTAHTPFSAGQAVRDLMLEASVKVAAESYIQGPSFAHFDVRIRRDLEQTGISFEPGLTPRGPDLEVLAPPGMSWDDCALQVFRELHYNLADFYRLKALEGRILFLKSFVNDWSVQLLERHWKLSESALKIGPKAVCQFIRNARERRAMRRLIAKVWFGSALLEGVASSWLSAREHLEGRDSWPIVGRCLKTDLSDDDRSIQGATPSPALASAQQVSQALDGRAMAVATALGIGLGLVLGLLISLV